MSNPMMPLPYKDVSTGLMQLMEAARKDAYTLTVSELPPHTHQDWVLGDLAAAVNANFPGSVRKSVATAVQIPTDTVQRIRDGLIAVVAQIEAEAKAAPVMNAIQAMHRATRSDGRPPLYVDPLRAPDA